MLLKKELLRQATPEERKSIQVMLEQNDDFAAIYKEVFSTRAGAMNPQETEAAFAKHWNRLRKNTRLHKEDN